MVALILRWRSQARLAREEQALSARNPYTVCHGPYRAGTSRHGAAVRKGCHFCLCINEITLEP